MLISSLSSLSALSRPFHSFLVLFYPFSSSLPTASTAGKAWPWVKRANRNRFLCDGPAHQKIVGSGNEDGDWLKSRPSLTFFKKLRTNGCNGLLCTKFKASCETNAESISYLHLTHHDLLNGKLSAQISADIASDTDKVDKVRVITQRSVEISASWSGDVSFSKCDQPVVTDWMMAFTRQFRKELLTCLVEGLFVILHKLQLFASD